VPRYLYKFANENVENGSAYGLDSLSTSGASLVL
jgi:hypothetical protein